MAEDQDEVAILFAYIQDFDTMVQNEKHKIVQHLDNLFRAFDALCFQFGVQKIETVGPTYMAATGIKECESVLPEKFRKLDKGYRLM